MPCAPPSSHPSIWSPAVLLLLSTAPPGISSLLPTCLLPTCTAAGEGVVVSGGAVAGEGLSQGLGLRPGKQHRL